MRFVALTLTLSHRERGLFGAFLMPAEVMHNLGNEFASGLDEAGFEIFVRLVGLVDGARAQNQRRAQRLNKRRFGAVVHHVGFLAEQFLHQLNQLMVRRTFVAWNRRMQFGDRQTARPALADRCQRFVQ